MDIKGFSFVLLLMTLVGCGGSGGGDDSSGGGGNLPPVRPAGTVKGTAFDGLILNGVINIYAFDKCIKGDLLSSGETDSLGLYSVDIVSDDRPILIEITGGRYIEEASGLSVSLRSNEDTLRAAVNYISGKPVDASLTYFTNLATGLAEYNAKNGTSCDAAINGANERISGIIGIDIINTVPVDISDSSNATASLTDPVLYGMATAGISKWTEFASIQNSKEVHFLYNSIYFAQKAYDDIKQDGLLNGVGTTGDVSIGIIPLNEDIYRNELALNMLSMANSPRNLTGLPVGVFSDLASGFNNSKDEMYGDKPVISFDKTLPTITNVSINENAVISGTIIITVDVVDTTGLTAVEFLNDEVLIGTASDLSAPSYSFDTLASNIADGPHLISIKATNSIGNTNKADVNVVISNQGTTISNILPADNSHVRGTITMSAEINDPIGITEVIFNVGGESPRNPTDLLKPAINFDTTRMQEGSTKFNIIATNSVNNETTATTTYVIDNTLPIVTINDIIEGDYLVGNGIPFTGSITDANNIATASLFLGGEELAKLTTFPNIITTIDTIGITEGATKLVLTATDQAGNKSDHSIDVFVDNTKPTLSITTPVEGDIINSDFNIRANVSDNLELDEVAFYVDDVFHSLAPTADLPIQQVKVSTLAQGQHKITVVVKDKAGNETTASVNIEVDTIAPTLAVPIQQSQITNCSSTGECCDITATVADNETGIQSISINNVTYPATNGQVNVQLPVPAPTTSTVSTDYNFSIVDKGGNELSGNFYVNRSCQGPRGCSGNFCGTKTEQLF